MTTRTVIQCDKCSKTFKYNSDSSLMKNAGAYSVVINDKITVRIITGDGSDICISCIKHILPRSSPMTDKPKPSNG